MSDYLSTSGILERLQTERDALLLRLEGIPHELQNRRPSEGRWSIAEVLEHLTRIEGGLTKLLSMRGQEEPPPGSPSPDSSNLYSHEIGNLVRDRSQHIEAPERVLPAGASSAQEALDQLKSARSALLTAFDSANRTALDHVTHPHPIFGPLTLRSWIALVSDHEARHAEQIGEVADQLRAG